MLNFVNRAMYIVCFALLLTQTQISKAQSNDSIDEAKSSSTKQSQTPQNQKDEIDTDKLLENITRAFAELRTAEGRFTQISDRAFPNTGTFALRRPRRMRFDYDDPSPLLIVADGTTIAIADRELETVDRFPLGNSILRFLLQDEPDLKTKANILAVEKIGHLASITLSDKSGQTEGQLTLLFDSSNFELLGWRVVDAIGQSTDVYLQEVKTNHKINPRLFRLDDFDRDRDRRR